mmetsp:Transcript_57856/g.123033  ORF Transcript_57856/g.123033 Transcript_57856/m.123033 type:complete len:184 (-) Transcript_57856:218-769(-)
MSFNRSFLRLQSLYPVRMSLLTGFGVMATGDALIQSSQGPLDLQRNVIVSIYSGATAPVFFYWWRYLDSLWPGTSIRAVLKKTAFNQMCLGPFNSTFFLIWSVSTQTYLRQRALGEEVNLQVILDEVVNKATLEIPELICSAFTFWIPCNAVNFMFVPVHWRIVFMSMCSVVWGARLSFVVHR